MSKKIYIKDESFDPIYKEVSRGFYARTRIMPSILVLAGVFVFATQVLLPLMVFTTQDETSTVLDNATVLGRVAGFSEFEFNELENENDENKITVNNKPVFSPDPQEYEYLPKQQVMGAQSNVPEYFYITIPKLAIENAKIESNAETLNPQYALGHYPGTELPGEVGNSFIFGHSVLPWFFNPNNYKTIFSTLGKMDEGDKFYITYNNREYTYVVESVVELAPEEVEPLGEFKPKYLNESTMVLMTCSPPGTKLKRLLVNAVMVN